MEGAPFTPLSSEIHEGSLDSGPALAQAPALVARLGSLGLSSFIPKEALRPLSSWAFPLPVRKAPETHGRGDVVPASGKVDTGLGCSPSLPKDNRGATVSPQIELVPHLFSGLPPSPGSKSLPLCSLGSKVCPFESSSTTRSPSYKTTPSTLGEYSSANYAALGELLTPMGLFFRRHRHTS